MTDLAVAHNRLRPLMFSIAYRMLGSVAEAEDVVQDAFLKMLGTVRQGTALQSEDAFATTVTTRLAIDALRSARMRRERYVGSWLPEPILADDPDPAHQVEADEAVSIAFLVVLERLSPEERAVFLLREVFGYDYPRIAEVVGRGEANCRQLLTRARRHIDEGRTRFEPDARRRTELSGAFFDALRNGNVDELMARLSEDVVFHGDGGGKAPAIRKPVTGAVQVARFLFGLARQGAAHDAQIAVTEANGQPAARLLDRDGAVIGVLMLEIAGCKVVGIRNQINPDKLRHLGAVGDISSLLGAVERD